MAKTLIDLDEEALARAKAFYRTDTKVETVNRALRDAAARQEREEADFQELMLETANNLAECDVRDEAWR